MSEPFPLNIFNYLLRSPGQDIFKKFSKTSIVYAYIGILCIQITILCAYIANLLQQISIFWTQ